MGNGSGQLGYVGVSIYQVHGKDPDRLVIGEMCLHDRHIDLALQGSIHIITVCALLSTLGLPFACSKFDELPTGVRWDKFVHCKVLYLPIRRLNN